MALAVRYLFDWKPKRITALIRVCIRLGVYRPAWKTTRGVTISKPGKADYVAAKAYRVIFLLNCPGKMVEKVTAILISNHCEKEGAFHLGQYSYRALRSYMDMVSFTIARTQKV